MSSRWNAIEILVNVAQLGSFTAAADHLGLSKSHVSRQISKLENRLGIKLINRTTRKLSLTETGQAYYQRCKEIINEMDEAERAVLDQLDAPRGTLRITVAGAFGERYIAPAAASFMRSHPHVHIELSFSNHTVDIIAEGYDLAIRAGVLKNSNLIAQRIASQKLITCCTPAYIDQYGEPSNLKALKNHNCLQGSLPFWRFKEDGQHRDVKIEGNWSSNNGHAILAATLEGLGVAQLPAFYVHKKLLSGELVEILNHYSPSNTAIWAVYPSRRHLLPKLRLFIEHLIKHIQSIDYLQ